MGRDTLRFEATIIAEDVKDPEALYRALIPESGSTKRFNSSIQMEGQKVIIKINARDPTALRAALNSYLRLLALIHDVEERI